MDILQLINQKKKGVRYFGMADSLSMAKIRFNNLSVSKKAMEIKLILKSKYLG
jgi:hypothetical protein